MAYRVYKTSAVLIGYRNNGEAAKLFYFFSREFGLIVAKAAGVRYGKSKMRYHAQIGSIVRLDLIKGKNNWRITGLDSLVALSHTSVSLKEVAKIYRLVRKLVGFEEQDVELYELLREATGRLSYSKDLAIDELGRMGVIYSARVLDVLGYWGHEYRALLDSEKESANYVKKGGDELELEFYRVLTGLSA